MIITDKYFTEDKLNKIKLDKLLKKYKNDKKYKIKYSR